jgi:hypothetical protein
MTVTAAPARPDWTLRLAVALTSLITVVGVLFRQTGVPRYRTVWAEDGQVFGQCAFTDPSPAGCLIQGYDGWVQLASRSLAWAASLLPPALFSYAVTLAAALATAAAAMLIARAVADATGQSSAPERAVAAVIAGASLALVYPAGAEVGGNLANLHWILWLASAAVICCSVLGHRLDRWDASLVLVTAASSPLGLLLVVLLGGATLAAPDASRPSGRLVLATFGIAAVQVAASFVSPRNVLPDLAVTPLSPVGWLLEQLYVRGPFGGRGVVPGWVVGVVATVAFAALVAVVARQRRTDSAEPAGGARVACWAPWRGLLALIGLGGASAAAFAASTYLNRHDAARYDLIPQAGLVIVLVLATALLTTSLGRLAVAGRSIRLGSLAAGVVSLALVIGFATTFRVRNAASNGPSYPAAYRAAAAACDAGAAQAVVGISPVAKGSTTSTWFLAIPCDRTGH